MKPDVFGTVNAGLYFWNGKTGLFIDAIHKGKEIGFSDTPEEIIDQMINHKGIFGRKNDYLFTHTHEDHFDKELLNICRQEYPDCFISGPDEGMSNLTPVIVQDGVYELRIRDYHIWVFRTQHDGKQFCDCVCYAYLVEADNNNCLVCSDAILNMELLWRIRNRCVGKVDKIFLNLYQLSSKVGRNFLHVLDPGELWLYHLPYKQDDLYHYWKLAAECTNRYAGEIQNVKVAHPMSKL